MTVSAIERADALFIEQVNATWRDWVRYLRAHLILLEARAVERQVAFERADTMETQTAQAHRDLAAIPHARRAPFDQICNERRQELQATREAEVRATGKDGRTRILDLDAIESEVLLGLLAEAEGTTDPNNPNPWGMVPIGVAGGVKWYEVNVRALRAAPDAAAYTAGTSDADDIRRRLILAAGLGVGVVIFLFVWGMWPRGAPSPGIPAERPPAANGAALVVWPLHTLVLTASNGEAWTLPITAISNGRWPTVALNNSKLSQSAYWRRDTLAPLVLCAPNAALAHLTTLLLISGGDRPDRVYAVSATRGRIVDLIVEPCHTEKDSLQLIRYGLLQATPALPSHTIGERSTLDGDVTIAVRAIQIVGPGQDPALPQGQARVVVQVEAPKLDWPAYGPTLLLGSGEALLPGETIAITDGAELRYLVPLPVNDLNLTWSLTPPGSDQVVRWRATLSPPPDRGATLHAALAVGDVQASRGQHGDLVLHVIVTNRGNALLYLRSDDLQLTQGTTTFTSPGIAALHTPLEPGEHRLLELSVPVGDPQPPLVLTVGAQRFQITL